MTKIDEYEALQLENQLCFPLYACARNVINLYTPFFKPLGITYKIVSGQWYTHSAAQEDAGERLSDQAAKPQ